MKKFYNNNPDFGTSGPFEAESEEALLDEMMPIIRQWAEEDDDETVESLSEDFLNGLEEVTPMAEDDE